MSAGGDMIRNDSMERLKTIGTSVISGFGAGAAAGGGIGATAAFYYGQRIVTHTLLAGLTGGSGAALYLPMTQFLALRRGDDVLNHMAVGTVSGYFMAGFYGGAKALKIGMLGGALFGASFRLASQGFVDWREKKGEQLKQEREQVFAIVKKGFCN